MVAEPTPSLVDPLGQKFFVVGVNYQGYYDRAWRPWNDERSDLTVIEKDLRIARDIGFNALRMFVQTPLKRDIRNGAFD